MGSKWDKLTEMNFVFQFIQGFSSIIMKMFNSVRGGGVGLEPLQPAKWHLNVTNKNGRIDWILFNGAI